MQHFVYLSSVMEASLCAVNTPGEIKFESQRIVLHIHFAGITAV
jgi:hypothetical protein